MKKISEKLVLRIKLFYFKEKIKYYQTCKSNPSFRFLVNKPSIIAATIVLLIMIVLKSISNMTIGDFWLFYFILSAFVIIPVCIIRTIYRGINEYFRCLHILDDFEGKKHFFKRKTNKQILDELQKYLDKEIASAKYYSDIINSTTNENELWTAYNKCLEIMERIVKYEKYDVFTDMTPSENIQEFKAHYNDIYETFLERCKCKPSNKCYDEMEGHEFEYFCADLLQKNGFINVTVTQCSGDHGIDILAEKDDISYAIQCKCYSSNIGNAAVQQAHTGKSLYHKDIAVVITNQYFTQQAKDEAMQLGVKLWDRDRLNEFIQKSMM